MKVIEFLKLLMIEIGRDNLVQILIPLTSCILAFIGTVLTIYFVNKSTRDQIINQNRQSNRPRLKLDKFKLNKLENSYGSHEYMCVSKNALYEETSKTCIVKLSMILENIGYGLANNINIFSLIDGSKCCGGQSITCDENQRMKSTEEIQVGSKNSFAMSISISNSINEDNNEDDFCLFLCNYEDLNKNNYMFLIGLIIKKVIINDCCDVDIKFSDYYYQQGTRDFEYMINKHKDKYNIIINKIKKDN